MEDLFLELKNPADMLGIYFLAETNQITGEFIQEKEPPWNVFWKMPPISKGDDPLIELTKVWAQGQPSGPWDSPSWQALFRQFVLHPTDEKRLSETILAVTYEQSTLFEIVRSHFLLQQGVVEFACKNLTDATLWIIRIFDPSIWAFEMLPKESRLQLFSQVPNCEGIFVEYGWSLSDPANGLRMNRFRFLEDLHILVTGDGRIFSFAPTWQKGAALIDIPCTVSRTVPLGDAEKIVVIPRFFATESPHQPFLWKVENQERFKSVFLNESPDRFSGYAAWFEKSGTMWIYSTGEYTDRGLADIFTDAFKPYSRLEHFIFLPHGKALSPKLSEERIKQIFQCPNEDYLILEEVENQIQAIRLPEKSFRKIEDFLTFRVETVLQNIESFESKWKFSFPNVKKKNDHEAHDYRYRGSRANAFYRAAWNR